MPMESRPLALCMLPRLTPAMLILAAGLVVTPAALAQGAESDTSSSAAGEKIESSSSPLDSATPETLLEDFAFYVNIANTELAKANAEALIKKIADARKMLALVEDSANMQSRFDEAYRRAMLNPDLEPYAAALWQLYEEGRRARARDPQEIEKNIGMLTGNSRSRLLASSRLKEAKEYAVPSLLQTMIDSKDAALRAESQIVLREMGRDAVLPLCAALNGAGPAGQEMIARVLGNIQYPAALPFLAELKEQSSAGPVKDAAEAAMARIGGDEGKPAAVLFRELGERFFAASASLTTFKGEPHQLAWSSIPGVGINPTAVRSEVYGPTMAMVMAERSLRLDPASRESLSLWLAGNFSRQIATPEGYLNPLYPTESDGSSAARRDPMYYAVAAGSGPVQDVLGRAIEMSDTRLARKAIEALERNMAATGLEGGVAGGSPLVRALSYPDRRVQFEAAMAIAKANPSSAFDGSERVVPVLASAVRDADARFAAVVAREPERQQAIREALEGDGYTVIRPAFDLSQAAESMNEAPGVDLLVVELPADAAAETIERARENPRLKATPILAMMALSESNRIASRFERDALTRLARDGMDAAQIGEASRQLTERASGPRVTSEEATKFSLAALERLENVAVAANPVLPIADATTPLIASLKTATGDVRAQVANVLSRIGRSEAQVALMDAALDASGADRVAMLDAVARSAKRSGNMLEERQVSRLVEIAGSGDDAEATAAAALMGALNLPNARLVPLILGN